MKKFWMRKCSVCFVDMSYDNELKSKNKIGNKFHIMRIKYILCP